MSLYNISTLQTTSYYNIDGWDTNLDQYEINNNYFYNIVSIIHTGGSHINILYENLEPAPFSVDRFPVQSTVDSSTLPNKSNNNTVSDPLINLFDNNDITKAKLVRPINN